MDCIHVSLTNPSEGWVTLTIQHNHVVISAKVSYVYSSLSELVEVLQKILLDRGRVSISDLVADPYKYEKHVKAELGTARQSFTPIIWLTDVEQYEMKFYKTGPVISMEIYEHPAGPYSVTTQNQMLVVAGYYEDICLPFLESLESLKSNFLRLKLDTKLIDEELFRQITVLRRMWEGA